MSVLAFWLLSGAVMCEVVAQVLFKRGVGTDLHGEATFVHALRSRSVLAGVAIYSLEFVLWIAALSVVPLSVAIPFAALAYGGVVLASRFVLAERIAPRRWLGTTVVAIGVALVCVPASG